MTNTPYLFARSVVKHEQRDTLGKQDNKNNKGRREKKD